jgi:hypothetical protein
MGRSHQRMRDHQEGPSLHMPFTPSQGLVLFEVSSPFGVPTTLAVSVQPAAKHLLRIHTRLSCSALRNGACCRVHDTWSRDDACSTVSWHVIGAAGYIIIMPLRWAFKATQHAHDTSGHLVCDYDNDARSRTLAQQVSARAVLAAERCTIRMAVQWSSPNRFHLVRLAQEL